MKPRKISATTQIVTETRTGKRYVETSYTIPVPWTQLDKQSLVGNDGALKLQPGVGTRHVTVTKSGLLFQEGKDGKARAYDVDTGKVLWTGTVAGQSIGIPTMYESNGRQYVVFMAPAVGGGAVAGARGAARQTSPDAPHGYIAFALPKK